MSPRHPLSTGHRGNNSHFWGGLILLIVLALSIRWAKAPIQPFQSPQSSLPSIPTVITAQQPQIVQPPLISYATPIPRVEDRNLVAIIQTEKPPVVSPVQYTQAATFPRTIPSYWKFVSATPPVNALLLGPDGIVWGATERGLVKIAGGQITFLSKANGTFPAENATSLIHDGRALWVGTFEGLYRSFDGFSFQKFAKIDGLANDMIWSLAFDGLILWAGTQGGVSFLTPGGRFESVDKKTSNGGLADIWIGAMQKIGKWIFCGNDDGLSIWDTTIIAANPSAWTTLDMFASNLAHNWILALTVWQNKIWAGTPKGLCRLDTPIEQLFTGTTPSWEVFNKNRGLPSDRVDAVAANESSIWAGTPEGLCRYKNGTFKTLGLSEGLLASDVRALMTASDTIWVGTSAGIQALNLLAFE